MELYTSNNAIIDDIVFSSITEPFVLDGLIDILTSKSIKLIISYSRVSNNKIKEIIGKYFEKCLDSNSYDIYPFFDKMYNDKLASLTNLVGIVALPRK